MPDARIATESDHEAVTDTITASFAGDPLWTWMFPDAEKRDGQRRTIIGLYVECAIPNGFVWVTGDDAAAATVWSPPGASELTEEAEARIEPFLVEELGAHAGAVLETFHSFEAVLPEEPFYYLSFFGTHPDHRGRGTGMRLLAENLERIDSEDLPAYLESSNPGNNRRYERVGFRTRDEFTTPDDAQRVTTMWRTAR